MDHEGRIARVRSRVHEEGLDAFLVTNLVNVRYLTGFSGTAGTVLVTSEGATFFTDGRYRARATDLVRGADVEIYTYGHFAELLPPRLTSGQKVGVEAATMTLAEHEDLAKRLDAFELAPTQGIVEGFRRTKDADEVEQIRKAIALTDETYEWILGRITPGQSERRIALDLEIHMREQGADDIAFDSIVGSGPLSGHIHHTASERAFDKGDLVILDFGARVNGYCADMTRTVVLGPSSDEQRESYELVLAAQLAGIDSLAPGTPVADADSAARKVIEDAGRGAEFAHPLGHGIGLDIHEAPRLYEGSDQKFVPGDITTIEPGVYGNWGGVRIEDNALIAAEAAEVLTGSPKDELIEL